MNTSTAAIGDQHTETADGSPAVLAARIHGEVIRRDLERLILVDDDQETVRVRWTPGANHLWRCDHCGPQQSAACLHSFSAGLMLAEALLGLTRTPDLLPQGDRNAQ